MLAVNYRRLKYTHDEQKRNEDIRKDYGCSKKLIKVFPQAVFLRGESKSQIVEE